MSDVGTSSQFPAGGAFMVSPADRGTSHQVGKKPKQRRATAFPRRERDAQLEKGRAASGTPARGKVSIGGKGAQSASNEFDKDRGIGEDGRARPMSETEVQAAMWLMLHDAILYVDGELSPARAHMADLYNGRAIGNEEDGRSQFVLTVVRDTIKRVKPSLMRIFAGAEHAVEYTPWFTKDGKELAHRVEVAEQQTEYVTQVTLNEDNRFYQVLDEWFMDALIKNFGVVKWWTDESQFTRTYRQSGMTKEQIEDLDQDDQVINLSFDDDQEAEGYFTCEYVRRRTHTVQRVACLPPEEYLFTRGARTTVDDPGIGGVALFVAHRTQLTRSQLRAAGVSDEDIAAYAYRDASLDHNLEEISRQAIVKPEVAEAGPVETRKALYIEAFPYLDVDGDGVAELRRVVMLGPSYVVISNEPWDERPFAVICPDPQPHTIIGLGMGDYTQDLQKVMTMVARAALDSLALSVNPRVAYVEGSVSLEDLLNNDVGAPIRMDAPGQIEPILHSFVGKDAIDVLMTFFDQVLENRVGVARDTAGLNPEALQSTTAIAVTSAMTAAQQHIELIARNFAEYGLKPLMKGLLREIVKHPSPGRVFRFRGDYVTADPRAWDAETNVRVNVAIGAGLMQEQLDFMTGVITKQEQLIQNLGPDNPICNLQRYAKTLIKTARVRGRMDATDYFAVPPAGWQPPPRPNPDQIKAQAQTEHLQAKSQIEAQRGQAETQREAARVQIDQERAQAEMAQRSQELVLEAEAERSKHAHALQKIHMEYEAKMEQLRLDGELERARLRQELQIERERHDQEMALARDKHEHEKKMREREVENLKPE